MNLISWLQCESNAGCVQKSDVLCGNLRRVIIRRGFAVLDHGGLMVQDLNQIWPVR